MGIIEDIHEWGGKDKCYKPFDGAIAYPLHSQDFVRTGFQDICPTLSARDYKDPKIIIEVEECQQN